MRGKVWRHQPRPGSKWITPAYAGKSLRKWVKSRHVEDHPRLCGEKQPSLKHGTGQIGSPPPMRGKGCGVKFYSVHDRITPAYAGKSSHFGRGITVS